MVKITGIMLLLFMSAMTGFFAADSLRRRLCGLKALRNMLESLRLMVRYEALEVTEMVRRLCEGEISSEIGFISAAYTVRGGNGEYDLLRSVEHGGK